MFYSANGDLIERMEVEDNTKCDNLKVDLQAKFDLYNNAKNEKDKVELEIRNIKNNLLEVEKKKNSKILEINKAANEYNKVLMNLHLEKCGI